MSRYIDADMLYVDWYDSFVADDGTIYENIPFISKGQIDDAPSIDIELKRGKWIWDNDAIDWNIGAWICSNCHVRNDNIPHSERIIPLRWSGSKFCPNCGADMREVRNE